jgi:hypothetical protein
MDIINILLMPWLHPYEAALILTPFIAVYAWIKDTFGSNGITDEEHEEMKRRADEFRLANPDVVRAWGIHVEDEDGQT